MKRPPPSLQARALGWLAQREHSRIELRRKLLRYAEPDDIAKLVYFLATGLADYITGAFVTVDGGYLLI